MMKIYLQNMICVLLLGSMVKVSAKTVQISGAQLKPYEAQNVTEQDGCFYNVNFTGLSLPTGVIFTQLDVFTQSDSVESENVTMVLYKHHANELGELLIFESLLVEAGYQVSTIKPDNGGFDPVNELTTFGFYSVNEVAFCGASLTYVDDLIFTDGFD